MVPVAPAVPAAVGEEEEAAWDQLAVNPQFHAAAAEEEEAMAVPLAQLEPVAPVAWTSAAPPAQAPLVVQVPVAHHQAAQAVTEAPWVGRGQEALRAAPEPRVGQEAQLEATGQPAHRVIQ